MKGHMKEIIYKGKKVKVPFEDANYTLDGDKDVVIENRFGGEKATFPNNIWCCLTKLEIIKDIRTRIGEISMNMGDYYYLIQKLEELKTASSQAGGPAPKESGFKQG